MIEKISAVHFYSIDRGKKSLTLNTIPYPNPILYFNHDPDQKHILNLTQILTLKFKIGGVQVDIL